MRTSFLLAVTLLTLGLPASASNPQLDVPGAIGLHMRQTFIYRLQAFTPRRTLDVTANTCSSSPARPEDVVKVSYEGKASESRGTVISIDIRPNRTGRCTFTFNNGLESAVTTVTVTK